MKRLVLVAAVSGLVSLCWGRVAHAETAATEQKPQRDALEASERAPFVVAVPDDEKVPWAPVDSFGAFGGRQFSVLAEAGVDGFFSDLKRGGTPVAADGFARRGTFLSTGAYLGLTSRLGVSVAFFPSEPSLLALGVSILRGSGWMVEDFGDVDLQLGVSLPSLGVGAVLGLPAGWARVSAPGFRAVWRDALALDLRPLGLGVWVARDVALSFSSQLALGVLF